MSETANPELDLTISRIIKAPRAIVWSAWTDPERFAQWWIPAPAKCKVVELDLRPGGGLVTHLSEDGSPFVPHVAACFLAVDPEERIIFTDALTGGWRPASTAFITAIITLREHPEGTDYAAHVMHKSEADRTAHRDMGFYEGWGTALAQLAALVERRA